MFKRKEDTMKVVAPFAKDFLESTLKHFEAPAQFILRGNVIGRPPFKDGDLIDTSWVKYIDKVEMPDMQDLFDDKISFDEFADWVQYGLFCVTTHTGSKYYIRLRDMGAYTTLLVGCGYHGEF